MAKIRILSGAVVKKALLLAVTATFFCGFAYTQTEGGDSDRPGVVGLWKNYDIRSGDYFGSYYMLTSDHYWYTDDEMAEFGTYRLDGGYIVFTRSYYSNNRNTSFEKEYTLEYFIYEFEGNILLNINYGGDMGVFALLDTFVASHVTTSNLRIRTSDNVSSQIVETIARGTEVMVLEKGRAETIDGIASTWVKVRLGNGKTGWCFGGYLEQNLRTFGDIYRYTGK